ncbi:N-acetylgalactosaminyltransferase 7-like [Pollicipes pollicipes]|uniref:N-acetylgalactosaminyltransferase 7-like n=1 Tax=Pollicipes pollicipes TaxID=41117 RepID=UPI00188546D0|nr:N-acetylgalactosaminyltransferase 7-like [Pollicipes pollicipes]
MNMTLSDRLPLRRAVPDTRDLGCQRRHYPAALPAASVIIVFHNEGLSSLLRTVQSVLDRSPPHLLHEVLLVDDFSHFADLGEPLESAVAPLRRVRLLRSGRREGLIRAKSLGALAAGGEVLLFLDAHCEVNTGWLPPLLSAVARDRRTVAVPLLDSIDSRSFQYRPLHGATVGPQGSPLLPRGIFDWALRYKERVLTPAEAWMCGGAVQTVPCSRVGHVYRDRTPYDFGDLPARAGGPIISAAANISSFWVGFTPQNFLRVAHVWMDQHREHFLTEEPLACRSFDWYLATVVPELTAIYPPPPVNAFWGQVVHEATGLCVVTGSPVEPLVQTLVFRLSLAGRLISGETCAGFMPSLDSVVASICPSEAAVMTWAYDEVS